MSDHIVTAVAPKAFGAARSGFLGDTSRSNVPSRLCGPTACRRTTHSTRRRTHAFTLAELLVTTGVLVLLVFLAAQLLNTAATVTILGHKQMDADAQARQLLDRMAIDFAQMVKRPDVDYYVKSSAASPLRRVLQPGNDQIAFYSGVPGYYPTSSYQSPVSLVAYRVNSNSTSALYNKMERMGKGLLWNAAPIVVPLATPTPTATPTPAPVVFIPIPLASPLPVGDLPAPTPTPPLPTPPWPEASSATASWSDSELLGRQVFRFEYYYLLKNGSCSDIPWINPPHTSVSGMQDVSAIVVDIAVIDPKSKVLLDNSAQVPPPNDNITLLGNQLIDWANTTCASCPTLPCPTQTQWQTTPGLLRTQWQCAVNTIIANGGRIGNTNTFLPLAALSGIRFYERFIYLSPPVQ